MYHRCQVQVTASVGSALCKLARILLCFLLLGFYRGVSTTALRNFCGLAGSPSGSSIGDPDLTLCLVPAAHPSCCSWLWTFNCSRVSRSGVLFLFDIKTQPTVDFIIQLWIEQQIHLGRGVLIAGGLWVFLSLLNILHRPEEKNRKLYGTASKKADVQTCRADSASPFYTSYLPFIAKSRNSPVNSPNISLKLLFLILTLNNLALMRYI